MKGQILHTVWCYISGEAAGEIWNWSLCILSFLDHAIHEICWTNALTLSSVQNRVCYWWLVIFFYILLWLCLVTSLDLKNVCHGEMFTRGSCDNALKVSKGRMRTWVLVTPKCMSGGICQKNWKLGISYSDVIIFSVWLDRGQDFTRNTKWTGKP